MKKKMMIIACCLLLAGAVFVGIGILSGGTLSFYYALGSKVITDSGMKYEMQTETVESFQGIDVRLDSISGSGLKLELIEGDDYSVTYPKENQYMTCSCSVENGVLKLKTKNRPRFVFFQINFLNNKVEEHIVQVCVPRGAKLTDIKAVHESGDMLVNALDADMISLDSECGDVEVKDCRADSMVISGENGDVSVSGSACGEGSVTLSCGNLTIEDSSLGSFTVENETGNVKIDGADLVDGSFKMSYGNLDLKNSDIQTAKISLESGDARLSLTGKKTAYAIKCRGEFGEIFVDGEKMSGGSYQYETQNPVSKIDLKSEFGNIKIDFEK